MSPSVRVGASSVVAALWILSAAPALSATTPATFSRSTHTGLFDPIVADLNGDGRMDIAGTAVPGVVGVILNTGTGAFGPMTTYQPGGDPMAVGGGDINGDGAFDLVITINNVNIGLALLMGNGDGTFRPPVHLPNTAVADSPSVEVTDLNNDGRLDIAVAHNFSCYVDACRPSDKVSVLLGNGDGTFQPSHDFVVGTGMNKIAVGDFNRDGAKDMVISAGTARLYRLAGVGDGTFAQLPTLTLAPDPNFVEVSDVGVGDFNRDGIEDLAAALSTSSSRIAVLIGSGDGNFGTPLVMQEALDVPQTIAIADYNGDTFADIAFGFANGNSGLFAIRNGNGDGTFQATRRYEVPPNQSSIGTVGMATGNLNGDTRPDLAIAIGGAFPAHWVMLNTTGTGTPPPTSLTAPTLIAPAQDGTPAQPVAFDWSDVAGAATYRIQVDDSSTFSSPFVVNQVVTASNFTAPSLTAGRRYWWRVRGISASGTNGPLSTVRRFIPGGGGTPTPPPAPAAPTLVSPANGATGVTQPVSLDWSDVSGAVSYTVEIDDSSSFTTPLVVSQSVNGSLFTAPSLAATQHWWRVRAVNSTGTAGSFSTVRSFTPQGSGTPPPPPPGGSATLTVSASGRSGERVLSSPAGISVATGSTGSASFTVGTSITLSVTDGRDAIWSGACSSGGSKQRTCRFTINAAASVSANVQ